MFDPAIHLEMPEEGGIMVFTNGPNSAPNCIWASSVDNLSFAFRYDARAEIKKEHPLVSLWFCVRADELPQVRAQAAADLQAGRRR
jgi:hypothetical protein